MVSVLEMQRDTLLAVTSSYQGDRGLKPTRHPFRDAAIGSFLTLLILAATWFVPYYILQKIEFCAHLQPDVISSRPIESGIRTFLRWAVRPVSC